MRAFLNGKMMFTIFIILSISQLCLLAEPPAQENIENFIRNGKLESPTLNIMSEKINQLPDWEIDTVEKGKGLVYNPKWGEIQVINLDIGTNRFIRQKIQIKAGVYIFSFKCAAKVGKVQSSALSVHWNSKKVKEIFADDEQIHTIEIALEAVEGQNIVEIRSEGQADRHGMSISDLRLTNANLLKNGDFALPPIQREWESIKKLPFWEINFAQKGKGSFYNKRWGPVQEVLELDAEENYAIKQKLQLKKRTSYIFQMSYAAKIGCVATSGFSVSWNGKKIKQILASDENIHQLELVLEAVDEENILELKGESASDRFGMTIANLKLFIKQNFDNLETTKKFINRNFLVNGDFRKTVIQKDIELVREIPGWESTTMLELGKGKKYNPRWEAESLVLNLDAQANSFIRQKINLPAGSYLLRIKYASKSGSAGSSAMSIYWNAKLYKQVNAIDEDIHLLELRLVAIAGDNIIQISGLSDKQGICIADVSLNIDHAPVKYLLGVDNCIASYSKDRKIPYAEEENIIRNGDFNELQAPLNDAPFKVYYTLPYWISGTVEKGRGPTYNSRWSGSIQVLEMDSVGNTFIKQNFKLAKGNYIFFLRYAAKNGMAYSSEMSIYWNGQLVSYIKPEDEEIHDLELVLQANDGDNSIQIRGEGISDNYGMSITGLRLVVEKKKSYSLSQNLLINGNFKQTVINGDSQYVQSIPGWESTAQLQLANGNKYNPLWKDSRVLKLNSNANSFIRQKVILAAGFYLFRLNYAAHVGLSDSSEMSIYWNSKLVKKISANDGKLHILQLRLKSLQGYNILQIKGEGKSDSKGMFIADLSLIVENSSPFKYLLSTDQSFEFSPTWIREQNLLKNGDFAEPPITGVYQLIKSLPNWQIYFLQAQKGRGSQYNPSWGNLYVLDLDGLQNYAIAQRVRLQKGKYTFKMLYAAKQNRADSMGVSIHWNGNKVIEMTEKDNKIHEYEVVLEAIDGENVLSIKGEGKSDRQGITIANLRLTKGQSKISSKAVAAQQENLIKNGDFTELSSPLGNQLYKYYDSLPYWTSGKIEIGKGFAYNFRWGQKPVCEMDSVGNTFIRQNIKLTKGNYIFSLKYTSKRGLLSSSQMSIIWNGQKIKHITSKDEQIHSLEIGLIAVDGQNSIQIRGEGPSDNFGMTIADLKLIKQSTMIKIRQIQQNLLKNSNFEKPTINGEFQSLTALPGWEISEIQKGKGSYYNSKWTQKFVIKINAKKSSYLRQRIYLSKGIYALGTDYASTYSDFTSGLALFWNGKKVLNISCVNNEIHHLQLKVQSVNGQNVLQIRGQGTVDSKGVTIANLRLLKREDPANNPISQQMLKLNLLRNSFFSLPVLTKSCSYFNYLPYWDTKAIRKCRGSIYRQKWAAFQFLQMGGNLKSTIKQVINLQKGQYKFGMLFVTQGKNTQTSQLFIYWNGKKVACLSGNDQELHEFQMSLTSSEGENYLQLRGQGKVDDDSILITQLSLKQHSNAQADSIFDSDL